MARSSRRARKVGYAERPPENQGGSHHGRSCDESHPPYVREGEGAQPAIRRPQVEALSGSLGAREKIPDGDSDDPGLA